MVIGRTFVGMKAIPALRREKLFVLRKRFNSDERKGITRE